MEATEVRKLAALEDRHWWYAERRALLRRELHGIVPGVALDVGAAGGGNTRVLRDAGWHAVALEYGVDGAEVARSRGLHVVRGDAQALPFASGRLDLVVAFDVLEHLQDDRRAVSEARRVLRPGGRLLVAVPADATLWSAHDDAVGHLRRYSRPELLDVIRGCGLDVESARSWNVLLKPLARRRRRDSQGSDLEQVQPLVNAALRGIVALERVVPLGRLPGISLLVRAVRR